MEFYALIFTALAGAMQASFPVPMKLTIQWEWENIWLTFTFLGLVPIPALLAALTVPHLHGSAKNFPGNQRPGGGAVRNRLGLRLRLLWTGSEKARYRTCA